MLGIPLKRIDNFIKAWREPFAGIGLSWLEVEICQELLETKSISELKQELSKKYPLVEEMQTSKFYRKVNNLVKNGYLTTISSKSRSKQVSTSNKGITEIANFHRYTLDLLLEEIKNEIWRDIIEKVTPITGCLLDQRVVIIGSEHQTAESLIKYCVKCPLRKESVSRDEIEDLLPVNVTFLDHGALMSEKKYANVSSLDSLDDWPFKDNYVDVVIQFLGITTFQSHDILKEAYRVLKPGGYFISFELTQQSSKLVLTFFERVAPLIFQPGSKWELAGQSLDAIRLPQAQQIIDLVNSNGFDTVDSFSDVINTTLIAKKPSTSE